MAYPGDIPNLYAWYQADDLSAYYSDGDPLSAVGGDWEDKANSYDLAVTDANTPYYFENQLGGHAAVRIGYRSPATDGRLTNSAVDWRSTLQSHTKFMVCKVTGTSQYGGIFGSDGGSGSTCFVHEDVSGTETMRARFTNTGGARKADIANPLNEWHFWTSRQTYNSAVTLSKDGGEEVSTVITTYDATYPNDNIMYVGVDGGAFSRETYVAEYGVYSRVLSDTELGALQDYLRARYFAVTPAQNEQVRDVISRRLWVRRRAPSIVSVSAPLHMLDADVLDSVALEAQYGPAPDGTGWRAKKWARRRFDVLRIGETEGGDRVTLELVDRRPLDILYWDTARTNEAALVLNATRQSGVARITKGNTITFARDSRAWVENPADDTSVIEIQPGERALSSKGEHLEEARTNELLYSSFIDDLTGWTTGGTGVNGSAIDTDEDDQLYNPEMGTKSVKFTAGSAHTSDLTLASTATASIAADTDCRLSIDHKTDSGEPLYYRLVRGYDGYYWNNATPGWQSGSVDNSLGTVSSRSPADRYVSENIDVGSNATALTLTVLLPSGGTASRISHLYHAQIEQCPLDSRHASSRIVTQSQTMTREAASLYVTIGTNTKVYNPTRGTVFVEFTPDWDAEDLNGYAVAYVYQHNATADRDQFYFYGAGGSSVTLYFYREISSSSAQAYKTISGLSRGTTYRLAARWTSAEEELDLTAHTLSVFVDGVKGTDAVKATGSFTAGYPLYLGQYQATNYWANGALREWRVFPFPLTDEEIARLP